MHEGERHVWGPALLPGLTATALLRTRWLPTGLMGATLPLLGLLPPSDRWGIRGLEPRTTQKPRVGSTALPTRAQAQAVMHARKHMHMRSSSVHVHTHGEQAVGSAWPGGSSCDCLPLPASPRPFGETEAYLSTQES